MSVSVKESLKKAKELFQQKSFDSCIGVIRPILNECDEKGTIYGLLLMSACYDQLGKGDKAIDTIYEVLRLDSKNAPAWIGLSKFCLKEPNRFYILSTKCYIFLLAYYTNEGSKLKRLDCIANLIRVIVQYRLELPPGIPPLRDLCNLVLASDNKNSFALESSVRLIIDGALFTPAAIDSGFTSFTSRLSGLSETQADLDLLTTYTERLRDRLGTKYVSETAHFTVALSESFLTVCQALLSAEEGEKSVALFQSAFRGISNIEPNGPQLNGRWQQQGFLDVHISALGAVIAYSLNNFSLCESILKELISFCHSSYAQVTKDLLNPEILPENAQPSIHTDFLTSRLLYTPVRLFAIESLPEGRTPLHMVSDWAWCLLASNAANSTSRNMAAQTIKAMATDFLTDQRRLKWPAPRAVLFTECCLLSGDFASMQKFVDFGEIGEVTSFDESTAPNEAAVRTKLVMLWRNLQSPGGDRPAALRELAVLQQFMNSTGFTSHNHYLAGWLLSRLAASDADTALNHFNHGIQRDDLYFPNYLNLGHVFRMKKIDIASALQAYRESWRLAPGNPETAYSLASTLCKVGKIDEALSIYDAIDKRVFTTQMWLNYGLICLHLNKTKECVPALQHIVRAQPKTALYWEILAKAYMSRGSHRTALLSLDSSIRLAPNRPMPHILSAQSHAALLDNAAALASYARALQLTNNLPSQSSLALLALKGLIEININLAIHDLKQGMRTAAIAFIESALNYGSRVLPDTQPSDVPPSWLWYYLGYGLSLLIAIHDCELRIKVPKVIAGLLKSAKVTDAAFCDFNVTSCIDLSEILLALFLKASDADKRQQRETALAWVSLGLVDLARAIRCQTSTDAAIAKPLFQKHHRVGKTAQRCLLQAETCFRRALQTAEKSLAADCQLLSLAWFGLGSVYAIARDFLEKQSAYCFAMSFSLCDKFMPAGAALASKLIGLQHVDDGRRVADLCQTSPDSEFAGYWLAMSQLAAQKTSTAGSLGDPNELQCLLRAACFGFSTDTLWQLIPRVFQFIKSGCLDEENLHLCRVISAEYLNRGLACYPGDFRLWHDRGLLLQLSGFHQPAHYCLQRAHDLLPNSSANEAQAKTVAAHLFLSTCCQRKPVLSLCGEFEGAGSDDGSQVGIHTALALHHLSRGQIADAKQAFLNAYKAIGREPLPKTIDCLVPAYLSVAKTLPPIDELGCGIDPLRRFVILNRLTPEMHFPEIMNAQSALNEPSVAHELIVSMFHRQASSLDLQRGKRLLSTIQTWAFLRPDVGNSWSLLSATLRLYSSLTGIKKKTQTAIHRNVVACLLAAFTVGSPNRSSEILAKELSDFINNQCLGEGMAVSLLAPILRRNAVLFPNATDIEAALGKFCV